MLGGVAFGGVAAHLQTTIGEPSGENTDVANALLGVSLSLAIFAAGVLGAVLISGDNGLALPIVMIALAIIALSVVAGATFSVPLAGEAGRDFRCPDYPDRAIVAGLQLGAARAPSRHRMRAMPTR